MKLDSIVLSRDRRRSVRDRVNEDRKWFEFQIAQIGADVVVFENRHGVNCSSSVTRNVIAPSLSTKTQVKSGGGRIPGNGRLASSQAAWD